MEVPLRTLDAVVLVFQAEVISSPGAKRSRHSPTLEKKDTMSISFVAPTVMASGTWAGVLSHASEESLPAPTT